MTVANTFPIAIPNDPKLVPARDELVQVAERLKVVDQTTYERAAAFLLDLKAMLARVAQTFDPVVETAHAAHKAALAAKKEHSAPLLHSEALIKGRMAGWAQEQRRIAQAEQERLEREAREKREAAMREQRAAEEKRRLEEAEALEFEGRQSEALEVLEKPMPPPAPAPIVRKVEAPVPKVAGVQITERWSGEVWDLMELVKAIAAGKAPLGFVRASMPEINAWAGLTKGSQEIPGIKAAKVTGVAAGR